MDNEKTEPDEKFVDGIEKFVEQEVEKNRYYADGMLYGENSGKWLIDAGVELQSDEPSPVLLELLSTILLSTSDELTVNGKKSAGEYLLNELGLGATRGRAGKLIKASNTGLIDKEIAKQFDINPSSVTNALGTQKKPKYGTPRHEDQWFLNSEYEPLGKHAKPHERHQKERAEKLLNKTVAELLYFLNDLGGKEKTDVITDRLCEYLLSIEPFCNMLVKPKTIREHVIAAKDLAIDKLLIIKNSTDDIGFTLEGLIELNHDILKNVPALKKHIPSHKLAAYEKATNRGSIVLKKGIYRKNPK